MSKDSKPKEEMPKPEIVAKIEPKVTLSPKIEQPYYEPRPGEYHLVKLDFNGKEIIGSDVSIPANTYRRTFEALTQGDNPTYLLKKNQI